MKAWIRCNVTASTYRLHVWLMTLQQDDLLLLRSHGELSFAFVLSLAFIILVDLVAHDGKLLLQASFGTAKLCVALFFSFVLPFLGKY